MYVFCKIGITINAAPLDEIFSNIFKVAFDSNSKIMKFIVLGIHPLTKKCPIIPKFPNYPT